MSAAAILTAPPAVQIHVAAACAALALSPVMIFRTRRDRWHKTGGYIWVLAVAVTALSSFLIHDLRLIGPFSPIHLLSVWTLWRLGAGLAAIFRRDIAEHQRIMRSIAFWALMVTGLVTLAPGRRMNFALFGGEAAAGYAALLIAALIVAIWLWRRGRPALSSLRKG